MRQMAESLVLLSVAVILFRGFAVEGYMISTGSMAPTLLGYHHRISCPECSFVYASGTRVEDAQEHVNIAQAGYDLGQPLQAVSRCPNCGCPWIPTDQLPRTEGDQLLVHKHAYEFRDPRRWEVIVFRNPGDPRQAYVKRVVGLPGETIELAHGNVLVNGELARKPYVIQRAVCIPVSVYASQVVTDDPDHQPSWVKLEHESPWTLEADELHCAAAEAPAGTPISWVGHRHWIRSGGTQITRVPLANWPTGLAPLSVDTEPLAYAAGVLQVQGAFTDIDRRTWLTRSDNPAFQKAINDLFEQSHIAPIMDEYGYNTSDDSEQQPVNEFLISLTLTDVSGPGRFEIELADGTHVFSAILKFASGVVEVLQDGDPVPVCAGVLAAGSTSRPIQIDFSLIDQQVLLAINGHEIGEPYLYERPAEVHPMRRPVRIGAAGLNCTVRHLGLFRDIFYTSPPVGDEVEKQESMKFRIHEGEFFVLGDNSPVSVDSRVWNDPAVPRAALIGKPLVVHLPSRSQRMRWGSETRDVRLPDFSRVRLVK